MTGSTVSYSGILGPGQTLPVALTGTMFYFPVLTLPVFARPTGGVFCQYVAGTGLNVSPPFSQVEVQNPNAIAITFQIFAGPADFIDHRLVPNQSVRNVINVTTNADWTNPGLPYGWSIEIPDLSGTTFSDATGNLWIALQRNNLAIQNLDVSGLMVAAGSMAQYVTQEIAALASGDAINLPCTGNFYLYNGRLQNQDAGVFEIYQAVAPGFAGTPPN